MKTIEGSKEGFNNYKVVRGYWDVQASYKIARRTNLLFGVSHAGYAYRYSYYNYNEYVNRAGVSTTSTKFIWGFPLGIENNWADKSAKVSLSTGYGIMYRLTKLGNSFIFSGYYEQYDDFNNLVFISEDEESNFAQNDNLVSLFAYLKVDYKLKNNLSVFLKVLYNQGLNEHETFLFKVRNEYVQERIVEQNEFKYKSRASYFSFGIGFNYTFNKLKKNSE